MQSLHLSPGQLPPSSAELPPDGSPSLQPTPSAIPPAQGKSPFWSPRALAVQLATVVLMVVLVLLLWTIHNHDWKAESAVVRKKNQCCKREAEELYLHVNFSISPCRSLYHHVCGRYAERPEPPAVKDFNYYSDKELYTAPNTTIGNAVHIFFQSCISATANAGGQGSPTAAAYLDVLRPTIAGLNTKRELLVFILRMTVKYNIQPVPTLTLLGRGGVPPGFYNSRMEAFRKSGLLSIIFKKTRPHIDDVIASRYERLRRDCLRTINKRMKLNVTLEAMESLETELDALYHEKYIYSDFSRVAQLVTPLGVDDWRQIVLNVSGGNVPEALYHGKVQLLSKAFSILLNDTRQPDTVVFLIFKAVSDFLLGHIQKSLWKTTNKYFTFCNLVLNEYSVMREVNAVAESSKSQAHDATFRSMFTEIVAAISRRAKRVFPAEDLPQLSSYLGSLRILLPSDIYPLNKSLPPLTRDYVRNRLVLFMLDWSSWTYQPPPGVTKSMSKAITMGRIAAFNDTVVIPIDAHSILDFVNDTEPLVFLSTIGVPLADVIWKQIFYYGPKWSKATSQLLRNYTSCQKGLGILQTRRWKHFSLPLLSIETAMEVARNSLWLHSFQAVPLWATSRCQLFYILFVYHHYCPGNDTGKPALAKEAQYIASTSEDFRSAFKCPQPKVPVPTCSLNAPS